jgi:hypothetical protein
MRCRSSGWRSSSRVERAQHAQHAHRLVAARVEGGDLVVADRRAFAPHQVAKGLLAHGAEQVAMQFDLGQGQQESSRPGIGPF